MWSQGKGIFIPSRSIIKGLICTIHHEVKKQWIV